MHSGREMACRVLSDAQRKQFVHDGFVKLQDAFPREAAAEAREILWRAVGFDPDDRKTWTRPVVRLGDFGQKPFRQAVNNELLHAAFDEIVGLAVGFQGRALEDSWSAFLTPMTQRIPDGIWMRVSRQIEL